MSDLLLIIKTTFSGYIHRRYYAVFLVQIMLILIVIFFSLIENDKPDFITFANICFEMAFYIGQVLAFVLGVSALADEIKSRTMIAVLARPVERWVFFIGKVAGMQMYLSCFLIVSLVFTAIGNFLYSTDIDYSWVMIITLYIDTFIGFFIINALCHMFSVVVAPFVTATLVFILYLFHNTIRELITYNKFNPWLLKLFTFIHHLYPAKSPYAIKSIAFPFFKVVNVDYSIIFTVMLENFLYGLGLLLIAMVLFQKREITAKG